MLQLVDRFRLFHSLDLKHLPSLITITAPSGCGKTVLAQQLINFLDAPSNWDTVNVWQRDSQTLHQRSQQVWHQEYPELHIADYDHSAMQAAHNLTQAIASSISQKMVYVLDDIHHLCESKQAEQWLQSLLDTCPPNLHLIFVGHKLPDLNWYREIGRGKVHAFNKNDLRLTTEDIQQMCELSSDEAQSLINRYNGWATGIRLALDTTLAESARQTLQSSSPEDTLFEQLAIQFFQQQSLTQQQMLLIASTSDTISFKMATEVFETRGLLPYLEQLYQEHLLVTKTGQTYQLHELFRQFLQDHLQSIQLKHYQYLHLKVAQWYEKQNQNELAIVHYIEAEAKSQAIRLAEAVASELHLRGLWHTILNITPLLGDEAPPRLQLFTSMILVENNAIEQSNIQLAKAEHAFQARGDQDNVVRVQLLKAHNHQRLGKHQAVLVEMQRLLEDKSLIPHSQVWAYRVIGLSQVELGQYEQAIQSFKQALNILFTQPETAYTQSQILQDLSVAYIRSGQFDAGIASLQDALAISLKGDNPMTQALAFNNLACAFHDTSQYEDALDALERAKSLLADIYSRVAMIVYHSFGNLYCDLYDFNAASHAYDSAFQIASLHRDKRFIARIAISRCRMAFWKNDTIEAQNWLNQSNIPALITTVDERLLHIWQEIVHLRQNPHTHSATTLIHHIQYLFDQNALKALSKVLGCIAYLGIVFEISELKDIFRTISGQVSSKFPQAFIADCVHLPELLSFVQKDRNSWQALIPAYEALSEHKNTTTYFQKTFMSQLELRLLGQDHVIVNGTSLVENTWATPQAQAFFYCLYFHGNLSKEKLSHYLWKDHSLSQARNALRDVRKRIKLVLPDLVIFEEESYRLNPKWVIEADITDFENLISRAEQLPSRDARTEELYLRAISLYGKGGLLPNLYADFLVPLREKYQALLLDALQGVAQCARAREDYYAAIQHYEYRLQLDPYDEGTYRDIMCCFAANRQFAQVQLTYNRLQVLLRSELAIEPDRDTQKLLHQLLN